MGEVGAGVRPDAVQGKGAVGEVGDEADVQAPRVRERREERRGQPDGPRPKRKKGEARVGWARRPRRRGTRFLFLFLNQFSDASIN